jgi:FixJ family two-component response regulator
MATVAVFNANEDVVELLRLVVQQAGHRMVTARVPDIKRGEVDVAAFVQQHDVGPRDAIEILGKPFDLNQVVEAVTRAVARQQAGSGGAPSGSRRSR